MKIEALLLVAAFAIPTIVAADDMKKAKTAKVAPKVEALDLEIVAHSNHVNLMEIDMGKLAKKLGTAKVKAFGVMLVKDHTAANRLD